MMLVSVLGHRILSHCKLLQASIGAACHSQNRYFFFWCKAISKKGYGCKWTWEIKPLRHK